MRRFPWKRRRLAAIALLPATAFAVSGGIDLAAPADGPVRPRISASKSRVGYGERVMLRGAVPSVASAPVANGDDEDPGVGEAPGAGDTAAQPRAAIQFRPAGKSGWRRAREARLDARGRYRVRIPVRKSGTFRVLGEDDAVSRGKHVRVRSRVRATVSNRHVRVGHRAVVTGSVKPGGAPRPVRVRAGARTLRTTTNRSGRFVVRWKPSQPGLNRIRVVAGSNHVAAGSGDGAGRLTAYRAAVASWFGPGLYGNGLACGGTLTPSTLGVAHRSFPCGAKLTLRYGNRSVRVRVVDRGPFVAGREFDLTAATKQRLGFGSTGTVLSSR